MAKSPFETVFTKKGDEGFMLNAARTRMNSDEPLTPHMISALLNVHVTLPPPTAAPSAGMVDSEVAYSIFFNILVVVVALCMTAAVGIALLYAYEIGPFHDGEPLPVERTTP